MRQQFFQKMGGYQERTDLRAKQFENFMQGRDLATLSKLDEARMLKELQEKDQRERKVDQQKNMKFNNMKQENLTVLQRQMLEKQHRSRLQKLEDDSFASIIK